MYIMNNKVKGLTLLLLAPLLLMACGKEEQREVIPIPEEESQEEIDMEQFRVEGDRVKAEPVLQSEERQERLITQYETIDRPILMNTLRYITEFDKKHENSFDGVRLITGRSIDKIKDEKIKEYTEHLGEPINADTTKIYDISKVYPYSGDDYKSYYDTVVGILKEEVTTRTQTYEGIKKGIEARDFDMLKKSGDIPKLQDIIDNDGGLVEQVRPYIEEMDKLVAELRSELGMEQPKYTTLTDDVEELPEYKMSKPMTVQEIMSIEPISDLYDDTGIIGSEGDKEQESEKSEEESSKD